MDLNNFYTGFGILLVYFTLVWQNSRGIGITAYNKAGETLKSSTSSEKDLKDVQKANSNYIYNPLNVTIDIISLAGILALTKLIRENWTTIEYSVSYIVLFSITLMHCIISIDLWLLNFKLFFQILKLKNRLKKKPKNEGQHENG